jgi:hypothetical protein
MPYAMAAFAEGDTQRERDGDVKVEGEDDG